MSEEEIRKEILHCIHEVQRCISQNDAQDARKSNLSFDFIWSHCLPAVRMTIIQTGLQGPDIDDAVQKTCIALWVRLKDFKPEESLITTFIQRIARNQSIDLIRKNQRRMVRDFVYLQSTGLPEDEFHTDACHSDAIKLLYKHLKEYYDTETQILVRLFTEGKSFPEIASALGVPTSTIKTRWRRFRRDFKARFEVEFS